MKQNWLKKIGAWAVFFTMLLSMLPGAVASDADITSWILAEDPASIEGTVRFWIPFKGSQGMDDMIAEFNETYPNINVELTTYNNNSDGNLAVNTALMAGEIDVLASFGLSNAYKRWENSLYMDLTDYIDKYAIDFVENWGSDEYKYDGTYYTFPCGGLSYYVSINMDEWNNAGLGELPAEWTWDEYLEASAAMTHGEGDEKVYGGSDYHSTNYFTYVWYQVHGRDQYYGEDGMTNFTDPLIVNALEREIKAEVEDKIWYPLTVYRADNIQSQDVFTAHKVASVISPNMVRFLRDREAYPVDWVTGFAPWPVEEKGQDNHMSGVSIFSHAGMASNVQDEEAAWYWLAWYSTYGSRYLICAGHQSTWKGTDVDNLVDLVFGSEEAAAEIVDVESFKRVVVNYDNPAYVDTILDAYTTVNSTLNEYMMYAHQGTMTAEEAMAAAKEIADAAILAER
ncbi:ABC transporter substrate-binding protein [Eubacteriales bacterium OttesenSCG-928-A19]|nr:ABC transporter substrate-binding protein [Eubacteriales bacterium OttesenSCG-928-A19]